MTNSNNKKFNRTLSDIKVSNLNIPKKAKKELKEWGFRTVGDVCAERSVQLRAMTKSLYPEILAALVELGIGIDNNGEFTLPEPSSEDIELSKKQVASDFEKAPQNKLYKKKSLLHKKKQLVEEYKDLKEVKEKDIISWRNYRGEFYILHRRLLDIKVSSLNIPKKAKKELKEWGLTTVGDICYEDGYRIKFKVGSQFPQVLSALAELGIGMDNYHFTFPEPSVEDIELSKKQVASDFEKAPQNKLYKKKSLLHKKKQLVEDCKDLNEVKEKYQRMIINGFGPHI